MMIRPPPNHFLSVYFFSTMSTPVAGSKYSDLLPEEGPNRVAGYPDEPRGDPFMEEDNKEAEAKATKALAGAMICTVCCQLVIWIGLGIFWLVTYLKYKDAHCEDPLPTWCLVNCIVMFCSLPGACLAQAIRMKGMKKGETSPVVMLLSCVSCLIAVFQLVWFILGNVWAWGQNEFQCDWDLLYTVRVYLVVVYICLAVLCYCACFMSCVGGMGVLKKSAA